VPGKGDAVPAPYAMAMCVERLLQPSVADIATTYSGKVVVALLDKVAATLCAAPPPVTQPPVTQPPQTQPHACSPRV
jgi:hypothetical protein